MYSSVTLVLILLHPCGFGGFDWVGVHPSPGHGLHEEVAKKRAHDPGHLGFALFDIGRQVIGDIHGGQRAYTPIAEGFLDPVQAHAKLPYKAQQAGRLSDDRRNRQRQGTDLQAVCGCRSMPRNPNLARLSRR